MALDGFVHILAVGWVCAGDVATGLSSHGDLGLFTW